MVTVNAHGKGRVVFVNYPIEIDSVRRDDCFAGREPNPAYLVYRKAAELAGVRRVVSSGLPFVGFTEHALPDGRTVVVAVNYDENPVECPLRVTGRPGRVHRGRLEGLTLRIGANDAAVFEIAAEEPRVSLLRNGR